MSGRARLSLLLGGAALMAACEGAPTSVSDAATTPTLAATSSADSATRRARGARNPIARILARREPLGLTADQVSRLSAIGTALAAKNAPLEAQLRAALASVPRPPRDSARKATQEERRAQLAARRAALAPLAPVRRELAANTRAAMQQVMAVLTDAQRAMLRAAHDARPTGTPGRGGRRGG